MIEVRGTAEVVASGGKATFGDNFEETVVRIRPVRIVAFGIDPGESMNARSVG
jgi:hypothetical protein